MRWHETTWDGTRRGASTPCSLPADTHTHTHHAMRRAPRRSPEQRIATRTHPSGPPLTAVGSLRFVPALARLSFFQTTTISRQRHLNSKVSDADMARAADRWPINTPVTKEEYYYRNVFSRQVIRRDRRGLLASSKGMNETARARDVARHEARLRSRQRAEE